MSRNNALTVSLRGMIIKPLAHEQRAGGGIVVAVIGVDHFVAPEAAA
jgi:hypothetical protein